MKLAKQLALSTCVASLFLFQYSTTTTADALDATCPNTNTMTRFRSVRRVMEKPSKHWVGDGFNVLPVFADLAFTEELSPMLMFDYAEPKSFPSKVGRPRGVGPHPHRGMETVTIAFQGEIEHRDNKGNEGVIGPGDIQWMTAGRGIVHEEYHSNKFSMGYADDKLEMCQLWVNLPKKHKMTKPRYQPILKDKVPSVNLPIGSEEPLGNARIIAGELNGTKGVAKTFSPVQMWDVSLPHVGSEIDIPYPADHNCIIFVRRGRVSVLSGEDGDGKKSELGPQDVALMRLDGSDILRLRVDAADSSVLIMGGEPLNEPIRAQGPFVMNDEEGIRKAISDYRSGKF